MKICKVCGEEKPLDQFFSRTRLRNTGEPYTSYQNDCKKCYQAKQNARNKARRERREDNVSEKVADLWNKFLMT